MWPQLQDPPAGPADNERRTHAVRSSAVLSTLEEVCHQLRASTSAGHALDVDEAVTAALHDAQQESVAGGVGMDTLETEAGQPFSMGPAVKAGWLSKRGAINSTPRQRWFILEAGTLSWYAKPPPSGKSSAAANVWAHGCVSLLGATCEALPVTLPVGEGFDTSQATSDLRPANGSGKDEQPGGFELRVRLASAVKRPSMGAALARGRLQMGPSATLGQGRVLHLVANSLAEQEEWLQALIGHASAGRDAEASTDHAASWAPFKSKIMGAVRLDSFRNARSSTSLGVQERAQVEALLREKDAEISTLRAQLGMLSTELHHAEDQREVVRVSSGRCSEEWGLLLKRCIMGTS